MVQIASNDTCFIEADALEAFRHLKQIYRAAGVEENLQLDNFEGVHEIDLEPAAEFLKKHLS
jgi:hypothetical protein